MNIPLLSPLMGYVLKFFSDLCGGNFALAVLIFTVLVNLLMLPLTIKSQKSTAKQAMLKPKMDALKKKYGNDQVKYNTALQELYKRENVTMSGGCMPMILRLVFMMGVYSVVLSPLTHLTNVDSATIKAAMAEAGNIREMQLVSLVQQGGVAGIPASVLGNLDFTFLGINLTETPHFTLDFVNGFKVIWWIPIISFATSMLTSLVTLAIQKKANPGQKTMSGMMLTMPIMSLIIAFTVPGAVGFYWACSNLVAGATQAYAQMVYSPNKLVAEGQAAFVLKRAAEEDKKKQTSAAKKSAE